MVKILSFEAENFKRIRAVRFEPTANGLTVIGGNNAEGKTSVLDAIAFALGGKKYAPAHPTRDGSVLPGKIELTLSNGLLVTRKGKNASLTVTDPSGAKAGQALLDSFVSTFALDLPKFMTSSDKDKVTVLLHALGIEEELAAADFAVTSAYNERAFQRKVADSAAAKAKTLPHYEDAPSEEVSVAEITQKVMEANRKNAERQQKIAEADRLSASAGNHENNIEAIKAKIEKLKEEIAGCEEEIERQIGFMVEDARKAEQIREFIPKEIDTTPLMEQIEAAGEINAKVQANQTWADAQKTARDEKAKFDTAEAKLAAAREARDRLLDPEKMPVNGLSVEDGALCFNGHPWGEMSGAEQLVVSAAIVRKTAPDCGFILMDKLEQMDKDTLAKFGAWAEKQSLQIIATRVSTGDECSIIIEDGEITGEEKPKEEAQPEAEQEYEF